jgi:hypothetical protein
MYEVSRCVNPMGFFRGVYSDYFQALQGASRWMFSGCFSEHFQQYPAHFISYSGCHLSWLSHKNQHLAIGEEKSILAFSTAQKKTPPAPSIILKGCLQNRKVF